MKIGILTQPLHNNYGGILQAYALQKVLKDMGHEALIIQRCNNKRNFFDIFLFQLKAFIKRHIGRDYYPLLSIEWQEHICKNNSLFIDEYVYPKSAKLFTDVSFRSYVGSQNFDAFIVGSDQVWRPVYSPRIETYFLDFVPRDSRVKKIAYAASFGVDRWEFNKNETGGCAALAKTFGAISVRENTGVELCNKYLGVHAEHVLDPTMLLDKSVYEKIAMKSRISSGDLFYYLLDLSSKKVAILSNINERIGGTPFTALPLSATYKNFRKEKSLNAYVYPGPSSWLRGFYDSKFVVTDSFHGCVFSIIFNRPFIAIGNEGRGMSRFKSLLSLFDLEERLVSPSEDIPITLIDKEIDWVKVNRKKEQLRDKSFQFLIQALNNE